MVATLNFNDSIRLLDTGEGQQLKDFEDDIADRIMVLDSIKETLSILVESYMQFCQSSTMINQGSSTHEPDEIVSTLCMWQRDILNHRHKLETLQKKVSSTTQLASLEEQYAL